MGVLCIYILCKKRIEHLTHWKRHIEEFRGGGGMNQLDKLMLDPDRVREVIMNDMKNIRVLREIVIRAYCPSSFGLEEHCSEDPSSSCEWCWNQEATE